jgi:acetylornithine deacetylase
VPGSVDAGFATVDAAIQAGAGRAFAFLERLIAAPSTVGDEAPAQRIVSGELADLGFGVEQVPVPPGTPDQPGAGLAQAPYPGRDNVLGRISPGASPSLLLNGHVDVVPAEVAVWPGDPFTPVTTGGWMRGRGAGDMKGGFAMGLLAVAALRQAMPDAISGELGFLSVIEEECTGNGTLAACHAGVLGDAVILHALAGLEDEINAEATDAAFAGLARPYNLNVGMVQAGDWASSVPARAVLRIRAGYPRGWTAGEAFARVEAAVRKASAGHPWLAAHPPRLRPSGFRAEGYLLAPGHPLAAAVADAHASAHGHRPREFVLGSTADARYYLNQFGRPALAYGPEARNIHAVGEAVELASIVRGAQTLARFIARYFAGDGLPGGPGGHR